jgi:SAM-dependent methyltransferase
MTSEKPCPICGSEVDPAGSKRSDFSGIVFELAYCPTCHFSFVVNPRTDFSALYDESFYSGTGADGCIDYFEELTDPRSIRLYEWRGMLEVVGNLVTLSPATRWLDYGSGLGGLVRYGREHGLDGMYAHDGGFAAERMRAEGVPVLDEGELEGMTESFDVVTAIEMLEHAIDPLAELRRIAGLLKPGGLLLATTGNARPHRENLAAWTYVRPDIHVSFFEPETLATALRNAGFRPEFRGYVPGYTDVVRFRVLKNVNRPRRGAAERLLPWPIVSRLADRRIGFTDHPLGWRV